MTEVTDNTEATEKQQAEAAYKAIAEAHTKEELVAKTLESFRVTATLIDLLRVLSVDPAGLGGTQKALYDTARARGLREKARNAAKVVIHQYDQYAARGPESESEATEE